MYALTGASGHLGQLALKHLLTLVPANQIIATARDPQKLAEFAAQGVIVRRADFTDPAALPAAFEGAERLLIISTDIIGQRVALHKAAIDAAVAAGVKHIVYTSAADADPNSSAPIQMDHGLTEAALAASGVAWTALRNGYYAEVLTDFQLLNTLQVGNQFLIPAGDVKPSWITREDCARSAAYVLAGRSTITGPVELTGPEALGFSDIVQRWAGVDGPALTVSVLSDEELVAQLIAKGLPEQATGMTVGLAIWLVRVGTTKVTDAVVKITGTKPTSIDAVLRSLVAI